MGFTKYGGTKMEITNTKQLDEFIKVAYINDGKDRLKGFDVWDKNTMPKLNSETLEWMEKNNLVMFYGMFGWAIAHKGNGVTSLGTASRVRIDMVILEKDKIV